MLDLKKQIEEALRLADDTKVFLVESGALKKVPETFEKCFAGRKALVVADKNTWKAAGERVTEYLKDAGMLHDSYIFPMDEFHCEWQYAEMLMEQIDRTGAIIVAVGSGVINDLCKTASIRKGQQYLCVPTAASVDGYASSSASILIDGSKQSVELHAPVAIVADIDVIAAAPKEMTAAGYADLAAKVPARTEWLVADLFGTEPVIPDAWNVLMPFLDEMLSDPEGVARGDKEAVGALFAGLTISGIAMQIAKSSRPASCTDHLFSHWLDMTEHRYHGKFQSHGFQVAIGTLTVCAFFDEFFKLDLSNLDVDACVEAWPSLEEEQKRALEMFKDFPVPRLGYDSITSKWQDKEAVREELTKVKEQWPEFKAKLQKWVYPFDKMQAMFKAAGAPYDPSQIGVTRRQLRDITDFTQIMRWRINLLDLARRARIYDRLVDAVFAPGGAWEIER